MGSVRRRSKTFFGVLFLVVGGIVLLFTAARAIYYPFWAAGASREELARSWGGPSAIGATLVHWLVALVVAAIALLLIRTGNRWRRTTD